MRRAVRRWARRTVSQVTGRDRRLHWIVTGLIGFGGMTYVLHEHPALRETAGAVGGLGMLRP